MQTKKLMGCIPILFLCLFLTIIAIFVGGNLLGRAQEPDFIRVRLNAPEQVSLDEPFKIQVMVQNVAPEEILLHSIDVSDLYIDSVDLVAISPDPVKEQHIPIVNFTSYEFNQAIPSGGTQIVTFDFIGKENGRFSGEFDVCVEASILCKLEIIETNIGQ